MAKDQVAPDFIPDDGAPDFIPDDSPDFIPDEPAPAPRQEMGSLEVAARGLGQVGHWGDEAMGGIKAAGAKLSGEKRPFVDVYREFRDKERAQNRIAADTNPLLFHGPGLALAGATAAATKIPVVGTTAGAVIGGVDALGASEADLTQGEYGQAAWDTGKGAALGAVIGTGANKLKSAATGAAETFATSPLPAKLGEKFAQAESSAAGKAISAVGDNASSMFKYGKGVAKAAAKGGIETAQKTVAWMLDNAPNRLGKYAGALRAAAERGSTSLGMTEFFLSQSDPEYQEMMKKERNQDQ